MTENENYTEYELKEYLEKQNLPWSALKDKKFWKDLPANHQAVMCGEGMLQGFLIRKDGVSAKRL